MFSEFLKLAMLIRVDLTGSALKFTPFWGQMSSPEKAALMFLVTKGPFHSSSQGLGAVNYSRTYARSVVLETMGKIRGIL